MSVNDPKRTFRKLEIVSTLTPPKQLKIELLRWLQVKTE